MADLPPTQYLVMEVLAARARSGDDLWTFPSSVAMSLRALEEAGLICVMHGNGPGSLRARLTESGRRHSLKPDYVPPNGGIELLRNALDLIAQFAGERADLVPGMSAVADTARAALAKSGAPR